MSAGFTARDRKFASTSAGNLLKKEQVAAYVDELRQQLELRHRTTADNVVYQLSRIAFFNAAEALEIARGDVTPEQWSSDAKAAIASVKVNRTYRAGREDEAYVDITTEVRIRDSLRALKMLGDHLGVFDDLNKAIATLKTYGIELARVDGRYQVVEASGDVNGNHTVAANP